VVITASIACAAIILIVIIFLLPKLKRKLRFPRTQAMNAMVKVQVLSIPKHVRLEVK